jgi:DNA-binding transcriptional regulator YhcF (GntR family)
MDPYSGLFDMFESRGLLEKQGNRYKYITSDGDEILEFRKRWTGELLERVIEDLPAKEEQLLNIAKAEEEAVRAAEEAELDAQEVIEE